MTAVHRGLLDTNVFIADESGRPLDAERLPDEAAVSVVTVAELHVGVLAARTTELRSRRLATLDVLDDVQVLPVDDRAARIWARLKIELAEAGRRVNVNDLWIAATALAHDLPVVTQDADFDAVADLAGLAVIRV